MIANKTILILGAGQIGEACAIRVLKEKPDKIILHTLTRQEANLVCLNVKKIAKGTGIKIIPSWGNALVTKNLMHLTKDELHSTKKNRHLLMNYYYSFLNDTLVQSSSLYYLIKKWKPNIIIDGINTATVVGYQDDPYSLPRNILSQKGQNWENATEDLLVSNIIPSLIRFTQSLKAAINDFNVECYIKISTTGLGGMGNNLFYTHGDVNEPGMSSGILGKVSAAGIMHQLFWSLSHTPGFNIKVVVPAALVGWQGIHFGKFRSHGKNLPKIDLDKRIKLKTGAVLSPQKTKKIDEYFQIPYVDSGENSAYSLGEMTAITALGQMESVTREEVAEACVESVDGSTRHDLLTAMDLVALGPSYVGAVQRRVILERLSQLEESEGTGSIATNNLGPTVSKHLFELYLLMRASEFSIKNCIETPTKTLKKKIEDLLSKEVGVRSQIISLGLPIIFENDEAIVGSYYYVPNLKSKEKISKSSVDLWASSGWVDIRDVQINYWKSMLRRVYKEVENIEKSEFAILDRNWQGIKSGNIGELLGFIYSMLGGNRKVKFV